jgi:pimeloyl-ACP methyl ester carboxylesterase
MARAATAAPQLTLLDPYLMTIPATGTLTALNAIQVAASAKTAAAAAAAGLAADGTSVAIAVYKASGATDTVTFKTTNGAKVAAYNPAFLHSVTSVTTTSVSVAPTPYSGGYYAVALVIAGVPPAVKTGSNISVSAEGKNEKTALTATLLAIPTPVVLIHGLWGDATSLASTQSYLEKGNATYKANPFLVKAICYSPYLAFDAAADTLPGHGTGCEVTSAQALESYLTKTLYPGLDGKHWVGGRVDAVVHSMGGLVARHFTADSIYKSVRNRYLGAFRNVITLDTPETGSALATWLDANPNRTLKVNILDFIPYELWTNACGTSSTTTLATCFYSNGMPLAYKTAALSTGAVASLIPTGASVKNAPASSVFNTAWGKWYAIASDFNDSDSTKSLLRDLLNNLVAATFASGTTPATLSGPSMLNTKDNDVIVTVASQTAGAVAAQTKQYKDLQHTAAPSEALLLFSSDSNASVDESATVNGQVAYWLGLQTTVKPAFAASAATETASAETDVAARVRPAFATVGRMRIGEAGTVAKLGRPVVIPLYWSSGRAVRMVVAQKDGAGRELRNASLGALVGSGAAKVVDELGATTTVEVTPLRAGELTLEVSAVFADGGMEVRRTRLHVTPAAEGLEALELNAGAERVALTMEAEESERQVQLTPRLRYAGLDRPVFLDSLDGLTVAISQPESDPVVRLDADGVVHALRAGRAVIVAQLGVARSRVVVDVYGRDEAPAGYRAVE